MDEVGRFQEHHTAVACPAQRRAHISNHHVERLAVLAAQDVRVAHTLCQGYGVAFDDGHAVVQRRVVIAVVADGVADLLVLRSIAVEVGEKVGNHLIGIVRFAGSGVRPGCHFIDRQRQECRHH